MGRARDDQTKGIQTIDEDHALVWRQVWNGMIRWGVCIKTIDQVHVHPGEDGDGINHIRVL